MLWEKRLRPNWRTNSTHTWIIRCIDIRKTCNRPAVTSPIFDIRLGPWEKPAANVEDVVAGRTGLIRPRSANYKEKKCNTLLLFVSGGWYYIIIINKGRAYKTWSEWFRYIRCGGRGRPKENWRYLYYYIVGNRTRHSSTIIYNISLWFVTL